MGNNPSRSSHSPSASSHAHSHSHSQSHSFHPKSTSPTAASLPPPPPLPPSGPSSSSNPNSTTCPIRREPRRRESIHALPSAKATAAPPSESLASATAQSTTTHHHHYHHHQHNRSLPVTSRQRSHTIDSDPLPVQPIEEVKMGNEESRMRVRENVDQQPFSPSEPIPVPMPVAADETNNVKRPDQAAVEPAPPAPAPPPPPSSAQARDLNRLPPSQINRPPRLPLPIGEEVYTPGSPIISPADITSALIQDPLEAGLPRRSSILSSTTADDEENLDDLQSFGLDGGVKEAAVPTLIEWKQKGEKVYVTGTFAGWNRKFRLQKNEGKEGFSASIPLTPGTHHLKFLVDGDFRTADHLPTAVDFSNVLVNYLEVKAEDEPGPSKPIDIKKPRKKKSPPQPAPVFPPPGLHPPLVLPPSPTVMEHDAGVGDDARGLYETEDDDDDEGDEDDEGRGNSELQRNGDDAPNPADEPHRVKKWTSRIPRHLRALDAPESSQAHRRVTRAMPKMPPPPGLPGFLGKSILNGITPMKDDSSVLNLPNHTVLNHLATSSIKDDVLATSVTTRYGSKYVTTIMYRPTDGEDEGGDGAGEAEGEGEGQGGGG